MKFRTAQGDVIMAWANGKECRVDLPATEVWDCYGAPLAAGRPLMDLPCYYLTNVALDGLELD